MTEWMDDGWFSSPSLTLVCPWIFPFRSDLRRSIFTLAPLKHFRHRSLPELDLSSRCQFGNAKVFPGLRSVYHVGTHHMTHTSKTSLLDVLHPRFVLSLCFVVHMIPDAGIGPVYLRSKNNGLRHASFSSNQWNEWMDVIWLLGHLLSFFLCMIGLIPPKASLLDWKAWNRDK